MEVGDCAAAGADEKEGQQRVHYAGNARRHQTSTEAHRVQEMRAVSFTDGGGMLGKCLAQIHADIIVSRHRNMVAKLAI